MADSQEHVGPIVEAGGLLGVSRVSQTEEETDSLEHVGPIVEAGVFLA